jgi:hypothetical protein
MRSQRLGAGARADTLTKASVRIWVFFVSSLNAAVWVMEKKHGQLKQARERVGFITPALRLPGQDMSISSWDIGEEQDVIQGSVPLVYPDEWVSVAVGSDQGISATVPERGERACFFCMPCHERCKSPRVTARG